MMRAPVYLSAAYGAAAAMAKQAKALDDGEKMLTAS